jgi:hypothetical protein
MRPLMTAEWTVRDSAVVGELNRGTGEMADISPEVRARRELVGDSKAVLDDTLHVIVNARGKVEAYAFRADTAESRNLVADSVSRAKYLEWALRRIGTAGARWKARPGEPPPPTLDARTPAAPADTAVAVVPAAARPRSR